MVTIALLRGLDRKRFDGRARLLRPWACRIFCQFRWGVGVRKFDKNPPQRSQLHMAPATRTAVVISYGHHSSIRIGCVQK